MSTISRKCSTGYPADGCVWHDGDMPGGTKKPTGPFIEAIAGILRGKIATERLTQQQVAEAIGVSRAQMSKIMAGDKQIDVEMLDEICWAVGLSFRELVIEADAKTEWRHTDPEWDVPTLVRH